eukprot:Transcript_15396.p2 GENE.Transcript_15396~~Transcript_15396.p2  ORF type:complete len:218 (+),score=59.12 Transcript_15396:424-1077(+)
MLRQEHGETYQFEMWAQRFTMIEEESERLREALSETGAQLNARVAVLGAMEGELLDMSEQLEAVSTQVELDEPVLLSAEAAEEEATRLREEATATEVAHTAALRDRDEALAALHAEFNQYKLEQNRIRQNLEADNIALAGRATSLKEQLEQMNQRMQAAEEELGQWQSGKIRRTGMRGSGRWDPLGINRGMHDAGEADDSEYVQSGGKFVRGASRKG